MKTGYIISLKEFQGIKNLIGILQLKEIFVNGSFINEKKILLTINKDINLNYIIPLQNLEFIPLGSLEDYAKQNQHNIQLVREYSILNGIQFSWLETIQLSEMNKVENDIKYNTIRLATLYKKLSPEDKELSFLDF